MPRITPIDLDAATGKTAGLLASVKQSLGGVPNTASAMAVSPAVLESWVSMHAALASGRLPARLREAIALTVSEAQGCNYCLAAHVYVATNVAGFSAEQVTAARRQQADDEKVAAALRFAGRVVETRGGVTDAEVDAIRAAGYGDGEIAEIIGHVALNTFTNYFNKAVQTDIDFPLVEPLRS